MSCQNCQSNRIISSNIKCGDLCMFTINNLNHQGYVLSDLGIGGGDYVKFDYCLDCGQIQGKFPLPECFLEKDIDDLEIAEFFGNYFTKGNLISRLNYNSISKIIRSAKELSPKFGKFINNMIEYGCSEGGVGTTFPSVQQFIKMYRDNNYYLDDLFYCFK